MEKIAASMSWLALASGVILIVLVKGAKPWQWRVFLISICLIAIAAGQVYLLIRFGSLYELMFEVGRLAKQEKVLTTEGVNTWLVVIPLILGGVGANLLSSWLLSSKPDAPEPAVNTKNTDRDIPENINLS